MIAAIMTIIGLVIFLVGVFLAIRAMTRVGAGDLVAAGAFIMIVGAIVINGALGG